MDLTVHMNIKKLFMLVSGLPLDSNVEIQQRFCFFFYTLRTKLKTLSIDTLI